LSDPDKVEGRESQGGRAGISPGVGCLSTILIAVAAASLLLIVLSVALRGEARFTKGDLGELRLWMIRESANQGLGLSTTRIISGSESSGEVCIRTSTRFLMIRTDQAIPNVTYSDCYEKRGESWVEVDVLPAPGS